MAPRSASGGVRQRFLDFFALEPGEARPALLLTVYLLLAIASVIALKAISNSLFLRRFSAEGLPFVYVGIAATAGFVVSLYIRLSTRLPQNRLLIYTHAFFSLNLVLFWALLRQRLDWMPAIIYVWTGVYAVIIPSQVWTLANHIFTTRQARRVFAVVGTGGILGAALGGQLSGLMVRALGTENLLLTGIGFLLACSAIVAYVWRTSRPQTAGSKSKQASPSSLAQSIEAIRGSRHLLWMTILVVLSAVVNGLVDYQFKFIVRQEFGPDSDGMTVFFATFASYMAIFGLAMQVLLTSRIMRWFGLNFAIFVLPFSMLVGSSVLLFSAGLLAGILIKGFDGAFRHSIDRAATELLYVPLPVRLKQQAKSFIDMVASRAADALAGLLLLLLVRVFALDVQRISWVNIGLIGPWLGAAWLLRREYVNALRASIERKDISAEALLIEMAGASSDEITTVLTSSDDRAVETGLGLLQYGATGAAHAHLASLLTHLSPAIRRKAMAIIAAKNVPGCGDQVTKFLYLDDQVDSLWMALDYLERQDGDRFEHTLRELLEGPYPVLRGAAAARLLSRPRSGYRNEALEAFQGFVRTALSQGPEDRRRAAELMGLAPPQLGCQAGLGALLSDPEPPVVRAAAISAGRSRQREWLPRLLELLADRTFRTEVRQALASFGREILPDLHRALVDPRLPTAARRNLPRVFSSIGGQQAADYLAASLQELDLGLQYQALRALGRIRLRQPEVRFEAERVTPLILQELGRYYRYRGALHGVPQNGSRPGAQFLRRALSEQLHHRLDVIFRLIGLLYPPKDIFDAYYGISSGRRDLRANAVEFLDSTLLNPVRQMLLAIIEDRGSERIVEQARTWFGIQPGGFVEALRTLLAEPHPWLQACAAYAAADQGIREVAPLLGPLEDNEDDLVRETVRHARERLAGAASPGAIWRH
jgi:AAA family ATP:ADP antiporter